MFAPISLIDTHIVPKALVQHPIDLLYLAINLLLKCHVKRQFHPHLFELLLPKTYHKLGVSINDNELKHSMVPNPHVKEQFR
jgi:hypothetical protein